MTFKENNLLFFLLVCLMFVVGCNQEANFNKRYTTQADDEFARNFLNAIKDKNYKQVENTLTPELVNSDMRLEMEGMSQILDHGEPISIEIVGDGVNTNTIIGNGANKTLETTSLTYQLHFKDSWALASVVARINQDKRQVVGIHIIPLSKSVQELYAFTSPDIPLTDYLVLILTGLIPIFILFVLIVCVRTKVKRKWLWIIFIILGVGTLSFDWSNGSVVSFQPLQFLLLGVGYHRSALFMPWVLTISFPLGAVIFLLIRRKLMVTETKDK